MTRLRQRPARCGGTRMLRMTRVTRAFTAGVAGLAIAAVLASGAWDHEPAAPGLQFLARSRVRVAT